jgi:hypothetical protein
VLDWVAAISFLLSGGGKDFMAIVRAHAYILAHIFSLLGKRSAALPYKVQHMYSGSIVYDFYLRGKRSFKNLTF